MKKKFTCLLVAFVMLLTLVPAASAEEVIEITDPITEFSDDSIPEEQLAADASVSDDSTEGSAQVPEENDQIAEEPQTDTVAEGNVPLLEEAEQHPEEPDQEEDAQIVEEKQTETITEEYVLPEQDAEQSVEAAGQMTTTDNDTVSSSVENEGKDEDAGLFSEVTDESIPEQPFVAEEPIPSDSMIEPDQTVEEDVQPAEQTQDESIVEEVVPSNEEPEEPAETTTQVNDADNTELPATAQEGIDENTKPVDEVIEEIIQEEQLAAEEPIPSDSMIEPDQTLEEDVQPVEQTQDESIVEEVVPSNEEPEQSAETTAQGNDADNTEPPATEQEGIDENPKPVDEVIEEIIQEEQMPAEETALVSEEYQTVEETQPDTGNEDIASSNEDAGQPVEVSDEDMDTVFVEGYAKVYAGVTVYTATNLNSPIGSFVSDGIVYISVIADVDGWFKTVFDTEDTLAGSNEPIIGYVPENLVSVLSDESTDGILAGMNANNRIYQDYVIPVCEFTLHSEDTSDEEIELFDPVAVEPNEENQEEEVSTTQEPSAEEPEAATDEKDVQNQDNQKEEEEPAQEESDTEEQQIPPAEDKTGIVIISQPQNASASMGDQVTFSVVVEGENIVYQWLNSKDGENWNEINANSSAYQGALTPSLSFEAKDSTAIRKYRCKITSEDIVVLSDIVSVSVETEASQLEETTKGASQTEQIEEEASPDTIDENPEKATVDTDDGMKELIEETSDEGKESSAQTNDDVKEPAKETEENAIISTEEESGDEKEAAEGTNDGTDEPVNDMDDGEQESADEVAEVSEELKEEDDQELVEEVEEGFRIVEQPVGGAFALSSEVSVTVIADGSDNISYQWQYSKDSENWKDIKENSSTFEGAATNTLSFTATDAALARVYRCIVTSGEQELVSDTVFFQLEENTPEVPQQNTVGLRSAPMMRGTSSVTFVATADKASARVGEMVTLTVTGAEGLENVTYKWERSTDNASWFNTGMDTGTATMSFEANESRLSYYYRCVVTDSTGKHPSNGVKVEFNPEPAPSDVVASADKTSAIPNPRLVMWLLPQIKQAQWQAKW